MPIPAFDSILNVLPPHLGSPTERLLCSPYNCTMLEVCERFGHSVARIEILRGVLSLRSQMQLLGFQWFDGSFVEDIESQENRDPGDADVVTFVDADSTSLASAINAYDQRLLDRDFVSASYRADHFWIPLKAAPIALVDNVRYWYGLFSHRRDQMWKGMLRVPLSPNDDNAARAYLEAIS